MVLKKDKIPKNRDIEEMFLGSDEEVVETRMSKNTRMQRKSNLRQQFFDDALQEKVGAFILDIKMAYYKEGVGDISLEVVKQGRDIIIKTHPKISGKNR